MPRSSIAWAMIAVAIAAIGLGAFRAATPRLGQIVSWSSYAVLVLATLAGAVRGGRHPHWIGFAIFGWASILAESGLFGRGDQISSAFGELWCRTAPLPTPPPGFTLYWPVKGYPKINFTSGSVFIQPPPKFEVAITAYDDNGEAAVLIGQAVLNLVLGACVARLLALRDAPLARPDSRPPE